MASQRYEELAARLRILQEHFLPANFSPLGNYSERQRDYARAYRLLAHAEFEAFLEDWARKLALAAATAFKKDFVPRTSVLSLVAFHSSEGNPNDKKIKQLYGNQRDQIEDALDSAMRAFVYAVNSNNGIKQADVLRVLMPVGFRAADLSTSLLATMDSFGTNRGTIAHSSSTAQQQIDPKTELDTVQLILKDLRTIDARFEELLATC